MTSPIPTPDPIPLFRPSKKRKIYRQRTDAGSDTETHPEAPSTAIPKPPQQSLDELIASAHPATESGTEEIDISSVLRLRKQRKKIGGVGFTAERTGAHNAEEAGDEGALVRLEDGEDAGKDVETEGGMRRFAPQMGVLGNAAVDKHMMAYIEGKLARQNPGAKSLSGTQDTDANHPTQTQSTTNTSKPKEIVRAPTTNGQLLEIDLGEEARRRNMERTEMARRRAQGEVLEDVDEEKKARLGKDGKSRRWRKRRGSDDVQRDMLVEEILRENRLELYEPLPSNPLPANNNPTNTNNDDTLADLFRKDWEDAASFTAAQRQQQQAAAAAKKNKSGGSAADKAKTEEEMYMKGPKLGGSRSARAAMREMMLAKKKKF